MMNTLLLFFALPVATILLSVVLQKILNSPILVAITAFAIYLIVTFAVFDEAFLVFAIVYTILAYITAVLTNYICRLIRCCNSNQDNDSGNCLCCNSNDDNENNNDESACQNRNTEFYRSGRRRLWS